MIRQADCGPNDPQRLEATGATGYQSYPNGIKAPDDESASIRLTRDDFHGKLNDTIAPDAW
jgi:hypothetical protein